MMDDVGRWCIVSFFCDREKNFEKICVELLGSSNQIFVHSVSEACDTGDIMTLGIVLYDPRICESVSDCNTFCKYMEKHGSSRWWVIAYYGSTDGRMIMLEERKLLYSDYKIVNTKEDYVVKSPLAFPATLWPEFRDIVRGIIFEICQEM